MCTKEWHTVLYDFGCESTQYWKFEHCWRRYDEGHKTTEKVQDTTDLRIRCRKKDCSICSKYEEEKGMKPFKLDYIANIPDSGSELKRPDIEDMVMVEDLVPYHLTDMLWLT